MLKEQRERRGRGRGTSLGRSPQLQHYLSEREKSVFPPRSEGQQEDSESTRPTSRMCRLESLHRHHCQAESPQPSAKVTLQGLTNRRGLPPPTRAWHRGHPASPASLCHQGRRTGLGGWRAGIPSLPQLCDPEEVTDSECQFSLL